MAATLLSLRIHFRTGIITFLLPLLLLTRFSFSTADQPLLSPSPSPSPVSHPPAPSPISHPPANSPVSHPSWSPPAPPAPSPRTAPSQSPESTPVPTVEPFTPSGDNNSSRDLDEQGRNGGMSPSEKAGVAFGVIGAVALAVIGVWIWRKRRENVRRWERGYSASDRREIL